MAVHDGRRRCAPACHFPRPAARFASRGLANPAYAGRAILLARAGRIRFTQAGQFGSRKRLRAGRQARRPGHHARLSPTPRPLLDRGGSAGPPRSPAPPEATHHCPSGLSCTSPIHVSGPGSACAARTAYRPGARSIRRCPVFVDSSPARPRRTARRARGSPTALPAPTPRPRGRPEPRPAARARTPRTPPYEGAVLRQIRRRGGIVAEDEGGGVADGQQADEALHLARSVVVGGELVAVGPRPERQHHFRYRYERSTARLHPLGRTGTHVTRHAQKLHGAATQN